MFNLDVSQFDQTNLLFLLLSAVGLIRERNFLPFIIVIIGNLIHGLLPAVLISFLIIWHRTDRSSPTWVQYKDVFGVLLLLVAAVAPEPLQDFGVVLGVLMLSLSFGKGYLGVIPALLLLRQYQPHPSPLELVFGAAGFYWVAIEVIQWSKTRLKGILTSFLELFCVFAIQYGLKDNFLKWSDETPLLIAGAIFVFILFSVSAWFFWKRDSFIHFYKTIVLKISNFLTFGNRLISPATPFSVERPTESHAAIDGSFDRLFAITAAVLILLGLFFLIGHGGLI